MPPTVTALIALAVWFGFRWLGGAEHAWLAGIVGGYVWYDLTHYYLHHAAPTTAYGKWLRRYHLVHHFQTPGGALRHHHPALGSSPHYPNDRYQGLPDDELASKPEPETPVLGASPGMTARLPLSSRGVLVMHAHPRSHPRRHRPPPTADEPGAGTKKDQRLRNVKQLGFGGPWPFPVPPTCATRKALGAMSMATRVFDALAP